MSNLQHCYNKGCQQKFDPNENKGDVCQFHPGVPVFHDALKGWSCCKKRSTDFTEFLNIPGCTKGPHINVKPSEPETNTDKEATQNRVIEEEAPRPQIIHKAKLIQRPSEHETMTRLKVAVADSLKRALEKQMEQMSINAGNKNAGDSGKSTEVSVGTSCKNNACSATYKDESSNEEDCIHHPGSPIFHEGMKYWSCCKKKTTDFDNFLQQVGCTTGRHLWIKQEDPNKKVACRYDMHQTPGFVSISVYAKVANPEYSYVEANQVALKVHVEFESGKSIFEKLITLSGIIDPKQSSVKMLGTKVEINLKKAEPGHWQKLEVEPQPATEQQQQQDS